MIQMTSSDENLSRDIQPILRDETQEDAEEIVRAAAPHMTDAEVKAWAKQLRGK